MAVSDPVRTTSRTNGLAIAGLVCGVIGIFFANIILGPLALIFGFVGLNRAKRGAGGRGMALAAVILGVIDILLFIGALVLVSSGNHSVWHV